MEGCSGTECYELRGPVEAELHGREKTERIVRRREPKDGEFEASRSRLVTRHGVLCCSMRETLRIGAKLRSREEDREGAQEQRGPRAPGSGAIGCRGQKQGGRVELMDLDLNQKRSRGRAEDIGWLAAHGMD